MSKKEKTKAVEKKSETDEVKVTSVQFWRVVARNLLPKERDEWHIGEVALAMQLHAGLLGKTWKQIDDYLNEHEKASMGIRLVFNRKNEKPSVSSSISGCVECVDESAESDVPDPSQTELPGMEEESDLPAPEVRYNRTAGEEAANA